MLQTNPFVFRGCSKFWVSLPCGHAQVHPATKAVSSGPPPNVPNPRKTAGAASDTPATAKLELGVMQASMGSRSSLDCGCMRRWAVQIGGVAHRFCSGCKLYHNLAFFENAKIEKRPSKVCALFKERRRWGPRTR